MTGRLKALARSGAVHAAVAFLAMGGWAVFANRNHPMPAPLVAGVVQGTLSTVLTLFLKGVVDALVLRLSGLAAYVLPPLAAIAGSASILAGLHRLAGTPEILRTIAVPLVVSTSYVLLYTAAKVRGREA